MMILLHKREGQLTQLFRNGFCPELVPRAAAHKILSTITMTVQVFIQKSCTKQKWNGLFTEFTVKPGLSESDLYETLNYTNFWPGPGKIPFNPLH